MVSFLGPTSLLLSVVSLVYSVVHFFQNRAILESEQFPLFFNVDGEVVSTGSGMWFSIYPIMCILCFVFFTWLVSKPSSWYIPATLNDENILPLLDQTFRFLLLLQLWVFGFIVSCQFLVVDLLSQPDQITLPQDYFSGVVTILLIIIIYYGISVYRIS
eukprot:TRINITY_DN9789_c0_g2_i1.p1 TRINITY_DN9789_c0_g2~~TRINITY_DN9789_c0_g2_i1.p1  ORF type:complete len:159 (-),score=6.61 TRINITY_DN9789_c0_g2_i1:228-704(-)